MKHEVFVKIKDCPSYKVSNYGKVISFKRGKYRMLKLSPSKKGHFRIGLYENEYKMRIGLHVLVLETFGPPKPSPELECAHNDGNPANNYIGNLRWATALDNATDMIKHGTRRTNPENPVFKKRISMGLKQTEFAELLGEKQAQISRWELEIYKPKKKVMEKLLSL